jgi:acyl-homoserine lactone acylase PvdQ
VGEPQSAFGSLSESIWAGGTSGIPGSAFYANLLPYWLTNHTLPLVLRARDADGGITSKFVPQK